MGMRILHLELNAVAMASWRMRELAKPPTINKQLTLFSSGCLSTSSMWVTIPLTTGSNSCFISSGSKLTYSLWGRPAVAEVLETVWRNFWEARILVTLPSEARLPVFFSSKLFINSSQSLGYLRRKSSMADCPYRFSSKLTKLRSTYIPP